jgi:hypothetical protein
LAVCQIEPTRWAICLPHGCASKQAGLPCQVSQARPSVRSPERRTAPCGDTVGVQ